MRIELLVFEGCPNWEPARTVLRTAMASLGIVGEIQEVRVDSLEQARTLNFPGSPTLRVNGEDVAPLPEDFEPALGCRTYVIQGRRQGLPDPAWVVEALRKAQDAEAHPSPGLANTPACKGDGPAGARALEDPSHACCTPLANPKAAASCPACGTEGKPVMPVTLRSLLQPHLRSEVRDEAYRFCTSPDCALVYFSVDGSRTFSRTDLTVRVGVKERSAPRPLCYCFDHSAESIRDEWIMTGKSTVLESIKAELKAGTCHCEVTNPRGGCCLGDITKEVKALATQAAPAPAQDCCPPSDAHESTNSQENCGIPPSTGKEVSKRTMWASIGLGVLASACCWVPLALAGVGVATGTLGAKIAWIRPWALGGLAVLFVGVIGWWGRKRFTSVKPKEDCCAVVPKFPTLAVTILVASYVLAWASPRMLHPVSHTPLTDLTPATSAGGTLVVISTPQFDCPPCVGTLPQALAATPGVASVQMDFDKRETHIAFLPGAAIDGTLAQWKKELGFVGREVRREAVSAASPRSPVVK